MNAPSQCPPNGCNFWDVVRSWTSLMHGRQLFRLCVFVVTVWAVLQVKDAPNPTPILATLVFLFLVIMGPEFWSEFKKSPQIFDLQPANMLPVQPAQSVETPLAPEPPSHQESAPAPHSSVAAKHPETKSTLRDSREFQTKPRHASAPKQNARLKAEAAGSSSSLTTCIPA